MVEGLSGLRDLARFAFTVGILSVSMDPNHTWLGRFSGAGCTSKFLSVREGLSMRGFGMYTEVFPRTRTARAKLSLAGSSQLLKNAVTIIIPRGSTLYL